MVVLFDVSLWEFFRTPPLVASVDLTADERVALLPGCARLLAATRRVRKNVREAEAAVAGRLLTDLKGLSLPVHVMCDNLGGEYASEFVQVHRLPKGLPTWCLEPIGGNLYVLAPEVAVCLHGQLRSVPGIAKMIYEACGIFALCPQNERTRLATERLEAAGLISPDCVPSHKRIYAYYGADGKPLGFLDDEGDPLPWSPCYDRCNRLTELWKRPPLTSVEDILAVMPELAGLRYVDVARRASGLCRNGAASPAEVQANMITCFDARAGGEGWGSPKLNMKIPYTEKARQLAGRSYAVADCLWEEAKTVLEVNGEAFHADSGGFRVESGRRLALESMGYEVLEVTPAQMSELETLETVLENCAKRSGMKLRSRTVAFIKAREKLHRELFERPYEPVWDGARRRRGEKRGSGKRA